MYQNRKELLLIIRKYLEGQASEEEKAFLDAYYNFLDREQDLTTQLQDEEKRLLEEEMEESVWAIVDGQPDHPAKVRRLWPRIAAAASILLFMSTGIFLYLQKRGSPKPLITSISEERMPVQKGIILTLANGKQVDLARLNRGQQKASDGSVIRQDAHGLAYEGGQQVAVWHTLANGSANKYEVTLPDGSVADLDINSSITYPTAFAGAERNVVVTGQAYFKVRHDPLVPFRIQVRRTVIEDIGTEFNIDAYEQTVRTTLVEGAASVSAPDGKVMLSPGMEALSNEISVSSGPADVESAIGWLQGNFVFNHEPLESILAKIERIYDVRFSWQDESLKKQKFNGVVSRTRKLSNVLNYIRKTGPVDFVIKGKQILVIIKS